MTKYVTLNYALTHLLAPEPGERRQYGTGEQALKQWLLAHPSAWKFEGKGKRKRYKILRQEILNNF